MKILLFGGTGNIGQRILKEALRRGYEVHAVQRNTDTLDIEDPNLTVSKGDLLNEKTLPELLKGVDVVISAISPSGKGSVQQFKQANENLIHALRDFPKIRAIIVGGAASTEVSPGLKLINSPQMEKLPEEWRPAIYAQAEVLEMYKKSRINWTYFSPANHIEAGQRTGKFRLGTTNMIFGANGESRISYEDYAVALIDEIAKKEHLNQQFSIGY
jgi:uncharacterized protein